MCHNRVGMGVGVGYEASLWDFTPGIKLWLFLLVLN